MCIRYDAAHVQIDNTGNTQGLTGYEFQYEIKLKVKPGNEELPEEQQEIIDDVSWLLLDDDTLCSAASVGSTTYTVNFPFVHDVTVGNVSTWKFTDANGDIRMFWNPFQYPVDLEEMDEFVPVKQVRRSSGVPTRQWLLHQHNNTRPWTLVAEDNNIIDLTCGRYDNPNGHNAHNGLFHVRMNADEDYVMESEDPPPHSIPPGDCGNITIKRMPSINNWTVIIPDRFTVRMAYCTFLTRYLDSSE